MLVNTRSAFLFAGNTCAFSFKKVTKQSNTNKMSQWFILILVVYWD